MMREYLSGTCYICQKCLICFNLETCEFCKCNKSVKPARVSNSGRGQQIYSRVFNPNSEELKAAYELLFSANEKYQYNSNFDKKFSVTLCSTCHSRFQRKASKKSIKKKGESITKETNSFTVKEGFTNSKSAKISTVSITKMSDNHIDIESEGDVSEFSEAEDYDIDEVKLQIVIEKKGKRTSTSKTITIKPVKYINVVEGINDAVKRALDNKKVKPSDYSMSYKAINARGPSSTLEDKLDFDEFVKDYKNVTSSNKKMSIIIVIDDPKRSKVKIIYSILLILYI
jgi:hypothetical protein